MSIHDYHQMDSKPSVLINRTYIMHVTTSVSRRFKRKKKTSEKTKEHYKMVKPKILATYIINIVCIMFKIIAFFITTAICHFTHM